MKDNTLYLNNNLVKSLQITSNFIEREIKIKHDEIKQRESIYKNQVEGNKIRGKNIILVDDGAATGATLIVASRWIKSNEPKRLTIAITILPKPTLELLQKEADHIESLLTVTVRNFDTVGKFYKNYLPVEDEKVIGILKKHHY
jgi:predicted phosphoribosyltransferase